MGQPAMNLPDRWLEVSLKDGSTYKAEAGCQEQVEEAYQAFNEQMPVHGTYCSQDKVIRIPLICGVDLTVMVSAITYFMPSGKEIAEKVWAHNKEIDDLRRKANPGGD
jgi:hypothetical protein